MEYANTIPKQYVVPLRPTNNKPLRTLVQPSTLVIDEVDTPPEPFAEERLTMVPQMVVHCVVVCTV